MGDMHSQQYIRLRKLLRVERLTRELTQGDVAKLLKKTQAYVSKYEKGEREISLLDYFDIAKAIGFDPLELLQKVWEKPAGIDKLFKSSGSKKSR